MKKLLLSLSLASLASLALPAYAFPENGPRQRPDGPGPRGEGPGDRLRAMAEKLGLSDEQRGKIKGIFEKYAPQFRALMQDQSLAEDQKREKMMELRKAEMDEVRAVLTPEQQEKMKEMRPEGPGDRLKMMAEKLGLSDEQREKAKAIFEKYAPQYRDLMQNQALSPEEKREKMMALRKAQMEEIRAILTPEQQEKWKDLRPDGPGRPDKPARQERPNRREAN